MLNHPGVHLQTNERVELVQRNHHGFEIVTRKGAMEQFLSALKLAPDYVPAHYHMGLALRQKGNAALAEAEFERAHQLDPRLRPPRE